MMTLNDLLSAGYTIDSLHRLIRDRDIDSLADDIYDNDFYGLNFADPDNIAEILRNLN